MPDLTTIDLRPVSHDQARIVLMGHREGAQWAETVNDGESADQYELSTQARTMLDDDALAFIAENAALVQRALFHPGYSAERLGLDLWLTRTGHGAGFWCRDELSSACGQELTTAAQQTPHRDLYLGDDGLLYVS